MDTLKDHKEKMDRLNKELGDRPTVKAGYKKEDLREYAYKRKEIELSTIDYIRTQTEENKIEDYTESEEYREPLAIGTVYKKEIRVELSTGGDADGYIFTYERGEDENDYQFSRAVYY